MLAELGLRPHCGGHLRKGGGTPSPWGGLPSADRLCLQRFRGVACRATNGILTDPIPITHTILHPINLIMVALTIGAIVLVNSLMHPRNPMMVVAVDPSLLQDDPVAEKVKPTTPAERLENSRVLTWIITALGLTYLVVHIGFRGGSFDLNAVIMLFLFAGLLLHKTPLAYVRAFGKAACCSSRSMRASWVS